MDWARRSTNFVPDCIGKRFLQFHGRSSLTHIEELGALDALALDHREVADERTIERNSSLDANAQHKLPHHERRPKLYTPHDFLAQGEGST